MIMADILKIFLLVVGFQLIAVCYWLAAEALWPRWVRASEERYRRTPLRALLLGVVLGTPLVIAGLALVKGGSGPAKGLGFLLVAVPVFLAFLGSAGLARRLGEGLPSPADAARPWRPVLRGGTVLTFLFLLPFLGWFLVLPLALLSGVGTAALAARDLRRQNSRAPVPEHAP